MERKEERKFSDGRKEDKAQDVFFFFFFFFFCENGTHKEKQNGNFKDNASESLMDITNVATLTFQKRKQIRKTLKETIAL